MMTDVKKYIGNPLNSLLLIKQLSYDLEAMKSMFLSKLENFMKKVQNVKLPLSEFDGAVDGLFRLQQTYKLKSDDLARGNIEGKKYRNDLDVNDLMAIGKVMMKFDKNYGIEYLKLARQKNEASKEVTNIFLLEEIFQTYKSNEKHMEAVEILDELLKINPNNEEMQAERLQLEMLALFQENKDKADKVVFVIHLNLNLNFINIFRIKKIIKKLLSSHHLIGQARRKHTLSHVLAVDLC